MSLDSSETKKISSKEVQELVKGERNVPLIIDFYATWCGPCILMAQELEMLAVEYENNAIIVKVDTDDEYEFARDMQVRGLPTLYFISPDPNKDAIRTEGLIPIQMMRDILDNEM
ncbi:UNVERIFIED_CONTAM: Thioredoxin-like protein CITRX2, chloroplastic [Sesamum indicum]